MFRARRGVCVGLAAIFATAAAGCATLFTSTSQEITITSNVEGAEVLLNGRPVGKTPLTTTVHRESFQEWVVTVRDPLHQARDVRLQKTLNKVALFNCTSVLSWGTDALSGAMIQYSPGAYYVELAPAGGTVARTAERDALHFVVMNRAPLLRDVAAGGGAYLDALLTLLEVPAGDVARVGAGLRARLAPMLAERYPHRVFRHVQAVVHGA